VTISRMTAAAAALAIFAAGAAATFLSTRRAPAGNSGAATPPAAERGAPAAPSDVIHLAPGAAARAGVTVERVATATLAAPLRLPGTVRPNAYRQVSVTPLVGGRVARMLVELGQTVARGTPIAEVYSPEAAQARAAYLTMRAEEEAGEARLRRTERLAALGSASQQELEQTRADHVRHETAAHEAAARLRLIGIDPARAGDPHADPASTVTVVSPQAGVVIERPATAGMTAEPSTVLATIADLSTVWIVADVQERDIALAGVGAAVTATVDGYPGIEWHGRIAYVSPDVRPETRTAQARIEVANPDAKLKFGMFVSVAIATAQAAGVVVPASAVQAIGSDAVVFVPDRTTADAFRERRIEIGAADGDRVSVREGLAAGEEIVTRGSFALRAEAERQGVRPAAVQAFEVAVTAAGFEPASLALRRGVPARVTFTRKTDQTCATDLTIPAFGIKRALPLGEPVTVEFVPAGANAAFLCGMGMLTGTLVVR